MPDDDVLILECPRCKTYLQLFRTSYREGWPDGLKCGLCGPPHIYMIVALVMPAEIAFGVAQ